MTTLADKKNLIFYADDDLDDLQLVEEAFSKYSQNIKLETANDGMEAISYLKQMQYDQITPCLIILDINMPRLDGREALLKIRQMDHLENVPVILFSTSSHPSDKAFANTYNAGFITKPIDYTQLESIINTFIDHCTDDIQKITRMISN